MAQPTKSDQVWCMYRGLLKVYYCIRTLRIWFYRRRSEFVSYWALLHEAKILRSRTDLDKSLLVEKKQLLYHLRWNLGRGHRRRHRRRRRRRRRPCAFICNESANLLFKTSFMPSSLQSKLLTYLLYSHRRQESTKVPSTIGNIMQILLWVVLYHLTQEDMFMTPGPAA